mmetsp:Transcript_29162/g.60174  ORF Transcript_29162/g.60174 Transcript_29162/m.60174 type:complete len:209 (-) Transcript_29162:181-807(-)
MASVGRPKSLQKLIILGDTGTGKTSLMQRFVKEKYSRHYKATIGADFMSKSVAIGDRMVNLQIWDTAGQERFQSLGVAFYRGSDACVIVYDVTNKKSFANLDKWRREFLKKASPPDAETFPFIILGNKIDVDPDRRTVSEADAEAWCAEHSGIPHFLVSAKDGTNVEQAFLDVATRASTRVAEEEVYIPDSLDLKETSNNDGGNDCAC